MSGGAPVPASRRYLILDILRGFALLGICMANFPEFSLFSFLNGDARDAMPDAWLDSTVQWLLYIFVDGKFYTVFSLLFGIGFSIILQNSAERGADGYKIFYRRMSVLLLIGFLHLMFIWSGDILMLYALVGMFLPLFTRLRTRTLLCLSAFFLFLPVLIDTACQIFSLHPSAAIVGWQWELCGRYGITEDNFAYWLRDARSYNDVFSFLIQGAVVRLQEFVDGNRYFKVLGLFLIGYCIGRHRLYAEISLKKKILMKIAVIGLLTGLPLSVFYAFSALEGHPFGPGLHSLLYFVSVYITSCGYIALICLIYIKCERLTIWKLLAAPGRMALTNYIGQSAVGMLIFYGIGFGMGASVGLFYVELIVLAVYISEIIFSTLWLKLFRFGPLEWIWRCLTYGRIFRLK